MKNIKIIIFIFVSSFLTLLASSSIIHNFTAESNGDSVTVRWSTTSEDNLRRFELERSTTTSSNFVRVSNQLAKGTAHTYSYLDTEAFMKQDFSENEDDFLSQKTYNYRLKIVFKDNTFIYSDVALIKHKPSSIRRTWGMIKEMFR